MKSFIKYHILTAPNASTKGGKKQVTSLSFGHFHKVDNPLEHNTVKEEFSDKITGSNKKTAPLTGKGSCP